jgi:hypothetical protein
MSMRGEGITSGAELLEGVGDALMAVLLRRWAMGDFSVDVHCCRGGARKWTHRNGEDHGTAALCQGLGQPIVIRGLRRDRSIH